MYYNTFERKIENVYCVYSEAISRSIKDGENYTSFRTNTAFQLRITLKIDNICLFFCEGEGDLEGGEDEELDEATKQFNFWTHQVHIFFVRQFFPAAQRMFILRKLVQERYVCTFATRFLQLPHSHCHPQKRISPQL